MRHVRSKAKTVLFSIITLCLSVAFSLALLEVVLASFFAATEDHSPENVFDPTLGWKPAPGVRWVKPAHTLRSHSISINKVGLRNQEITSGGHEDVRRVVVLGDSFTFAKAVESESIFTSLLESHLEKGGKFEVINAGVPGYGTAQELLLMKEMARKEIVGEVYVLMVFLNDLLDNLRLDYVSLEETPARPGFAVQVDGSLQQVAYPRKEYSESLIPPQKGSVGFVTVDLIKRQVVSFLQPRPQLANLVHLIGIQQKMPRMPGVVNGWYHDDLLRKGIPLTKALIKEIQAEAKKHHAILLVSLIPSPVQVYPGIYHPILKNTFPGDKVVEEYFSDPMRPQRSIGAICRELEIPFLDLLPHMLSMNNKELYIPLEGHFSKNGHVLVAEQLAGFIESHLPPTVPPLK